MQKVFFYQIIYKLGIISAFFFGFLLSCIALPIVSPDYSADAVAKSSTTTLTMTTGFSDARINLIPTSATGTFVSSSDSELAKFSVATDNYTGYTLTIMANNNDGLLTNTDTTITTNNTLSSIDSATDQATFSNITSTSYNGKWGYLPSKYNSVVNTSYLPSPTTTASTLDQTSSANASGTSNSYAIGLGARVDYTKPAGTYTNTFILAAVANTIAYTINYLDATGDATVSNLPSAQSGSTTATSVILNPNKTPTRTGYDFKKWCLGTVNTTGANPGTICTGTEYSPGETMDFIDQTIQNNNINIYAVWTLKTYNITIKTSTGISSVALKNSGGTTLCTATTTTGTSCNVAYGQTYTLVASLSSGYHFGIWGNTAANYSHTPNINNAGNVNGNYDDDLDLNEVITVPGANSLNISLTYQTETSMDEEDDDGNTYCSPYDWVSFWAGNYPSYSAANNYSSGVRWPGTCSDNGQYGDESMKRLSGNISGDTVTFGFVSDGSNGNYGYYAIIAGGYASIFANPGTSTTSYTVYDGSSIIPNAAPDYYYQDIKVRYQNASGGWGNYYTYSGCSSLATIGSTHSCSIAATSTHQAASLASYTVTGATTKYIDVYRNTVTVSLTKGTGISAVSVTGTGVKSGSGTASATVYYGGAITITATLTTGYRFVNWTGSATYTNRSQSISNVTTNRSFKANGNPDAMQIFTLSYCQSLASSSNYYLLDSRNNYAYGVRYFGGKCWMTENLVLDGGRTLTPSDSNVTSNYTLPGSSMSGFNESNPNSLYYTADGMCKSDNPCYSYYSQNVATAGTGGTAGANAPSDICPKGWRLPTADEYQSLLNSYPTAAALVSSPFAAVYNGSIYNGVFSGGGSEGHYWSSTYLYSDWGKELDIRIGGLGNTPSYVGMGVRCVLK